MVRFYYRGDLYGRLATVMGFGIGDHTPSVFYGGFEVCFRGIVGLGDLWGMWRRLLGGSVLFVLLYRGARNGIFCGFYRGTVD